MIREQNETSEKHAELSPDSSNGRNAGMARAGIAMYFLLGILGAGTLDTFLLRNFTRFFFRSIGIVATYWTSCP